MCVCVLKIIFNDQATLPRNAYHSEKRKRKEMESLNPNINVVKILAYFLLILSCNNSSNY